MTLMRALLMATFLATAMVGSSPVLAASVRITVNDTQITDTQISLRAALLKIEQRGSSNSARLKLAGDELVDEALMVQEATRLGITVTNQQVNDAYLNVARNLKISADKLDQVLAGNGVNKDTLKARLKAGIAWQGVTQAAVMPRVQFSELALDEQAANQAEETLNYDFILKEVLFIIPQGSKISASRRTAEASQYRKSFQGCDSAVDLSLSYTDAAVIDVGRRHATQLPDTLAKELAGMEVGGITKPRVVDSGVSMLAVCAKSAARDLAFIKNELRQEEGSAKLKEEADAYLQRLRERASISRG
jgi:peptidyl-prolyl cis-trans isomerase SurA